MCSSEICKKKKNTSIYANGAIRLHGGICSDQAKTQAYIGSRSAARWWCLTAGTCVPAGRPAVGIPLPVVYQLGVDDELGCSSAASASRYPRMIICYLLTWCLLRGV
jgi:hypothetical protein